MNCFARREAEGYVVLLAGSNVASVRRAIKDSSPQFACMSTSSIYKTASNVPQLKKVDPKKRLMETLAAAEKVAANGIPAAVELSGSDLDLLHGKNYCVALNFVPLEKTFDYHKDPRDALAALKNYNQFYKGHQKKSSSTLQYVKRSSVESVTTKLASLLGGSNYARQQADVLRMQLFFSLGLNDSTAGAYVEPRYVGCIAVDAQNAKGAAKKIMQVAPSHKAEFGTRILGSNLENDPDRRSVGVGPAAAVPLDPEADLGGQLTILDNTITVMKAKLKTMKELVDTSETLGGMLVKTANFSAIAKTALDIAIFIPAIGQAFIVAQQIIAKIHPVLQTLRDKACTFDKACQKPEAACAKTLVIIKEMEKLLPNLRSLSKLNEKVKALASTCTTEQAGWSAASRKLDTCCENVRVSVAKVNKVFGSETGKINKGLEKLAIASNAKSSLQFIEKALVKIKPLMDLLDTPITIPYPIGVTTRDCPKGYTNVGLTCADSVAVSAPKMIEVCPPLIPCFPLPAGVSSCPDDYVNLGAVCTKSVPFPDCPHGTTGIGWTCVEFNDKKIKISDLGSKINDLDMNPIFKAVVSVVTDGLMLPAKLVLKPVLDALGFPDLELLIPTIAFELGDFSEAFIVPVEDVANKFLVDVAKASKRESAADELRDMAKAILGGGSTIRHSCKQGLESVVTESENLTDMSTRDLKTAIDSTLKSYEDDRVDGCPT